MITNLTFTNRLTKTALISAGFAVASAAFLAAPAQADTLTINLSDTTNSDAADYPTVEIVLNETAPGTIEATVNVVPGPTGYIGDLRGVFFNLPSGVSATISPVSGGPITASSTSGDFKSFSNSANLQGTGVSFNAGVEIGSQGISGGDDYQTTTFTISGAGLSLSDFTSNSFGTRMMSVGEPDGGRGLSSKTIGTAPSTVVTTPPAETPETPVAETPEPPATPETPVAVAPEPPATPVAPVAPPTDGGSDPVAVPEPMTIGGLLVGAGGLLAARRRKMSQKG
jgi:hypothetical protein